MKKNLFQPLFYLETSSHYKFRDLKYKYMIKCLCTLFSYLVLPFQVLSIRYGQISTVFAELLQTE